MTPASAPAGVARARRGAAVALVGLLAPGLAYASPPLGDVPAPAPGRVQADGAPAAALDRVHHLDASTESPRFGVEWRAAARARLGAELPLLGRRGAAPLSIQLTPLLELHNGAHPDSAIPNESWRGRLGLEGWWRAVAAPRRRHEVGFALEHESDHDSSRVDSLPWFLSLNDLALVSAHALELGGVALGLRTSARYYLLTCTRIGACDEPTDGQSSVGGALSLTADLTHLVRWRRGGPFAAVEVAALAPRVQIHGEQRVVAYLGLLREGPRTGRFQLYALAIQGNDVGLRRYREVSQVGLGLRWAPLW